MISIIVPIYNVFKYLDECLHSIKIQDFTDFEVICVDDGSIDNSANIAKEYVKKDKRFMLFQQSNAGVSAARNLGLEHAKGEYICFIDADDKIECGYLSKLLALSEPNSLPICSFSSDENDIGRGNKVKVYDSVDYIKHIFNEDIQHPNLWAMLFENRIIESNNLRFTVGCIKNEDTEFFVKYMVHCEKIIVTDYRGYFYRVNPNSVMRSGLNMKSITSIDAQARMSDYLVKYEIYTENNSILSNAVQVYVYSAAKSQNKEIYKYLHSKYSVHHHMRKMLLHPRMGRQMVAFFYLLLGSKLFYKLLSLK